MLRVHQGTLNTLSGYKLIIRLV